MTASRVDIIGWIAEGKELGATHVIVACDMFDYENYPIFVMPGESARDKAPDGSNMQSVDEVYDLRMDTDKQLAEHRAFHW